MRLGYQIKTTKSNSNEFNIHTVLHYFFLRSCRVRRATDRIWASFPQPGLVHPVSSSLMNVDNAGDGPSIIVVKVAAVRENSDDNAASGEHGNLVELSVVDPTKVIRTALHNPAAIAGLVFTTGVCAKELPEMENSRRSQRQVR